MAEIIATIYPPNSADIETWSDEEKISYIMEAEAIERRSLRLSRENVFKPATIEDVQASFEANGFPEAKPDYFSVRLAQAHWNEKCIEWMFPGHQCSASCADCANEVLITFPKVAPHPHPWLCAHFARELDKEQIASVCDQAIPVEKRCKFFRKRK